MAYFKEFPLTKYNNNLSRSIILKSAIVKSVLEKTSVFYNYIIEEGYRPDMVAYEEYGSPEYDWVVYLSNDITDPYYDWPIDGKNFKAYLEAKYNTDIYTLQSQILHYKYTGLTNETEQDIASITWTMSPKTHSVLSVTDPEKVSGWTPVYVYDYEDDLNDSRRSIKLISRTYIPQIERELAEIFK